MIRRATVFLMVLSWSLLVFAEPTSRPAASSTTLSTIKLADGNFARISSQSPSILIEIFSSSTSPVSQQIDSRRIDSSGLRGQQGDSISATQTYSFAQADLELARQYWLSRFQSMDRLLDRLSFCQSLLTAVAAATTVGLVGHYSSDRALNISLGFLGGILSWELINWLSKPLLNRGASIELKRELANTFASQLHSMPEPVQNQLEKMTVAEFLQAVEDLGLPLRKHPRQLP